MTAEIAILNKSAVALAADSAVTICTGDTDEKVFDSADKLFELCDNNPIGVMIYNTMTFMGTPIPTLIRHFRTNYCGSFERVEEAAEKFLEYLNDWGKAAPAPVKDSSVEDIIRPFFSRFGEIAREEFLNKIMDAEKNKQAQPYDPSDILKSTIDRHIRVYEFIFKRRRDASFVGGFDFNFSSEIDQLLTRIIKKFLPPVDDSQIAKLIEIGKLVLRKRDGSGGQTGIVVAGFGSEELFPTLVSFEIDGMVCDHLKFVRKNLVKINQEEQNAQVIPFAQKEMVGRFLYGLDNEIVNEIVSFCRKTVPDIRAQMLRHVEFEDDDELAKLTDAAENAEEAFLDGLRKLAFAEIRQNSRAEIEDMVEFMPKPELAKMAEALVDLTSIKRRVSRGMETVGGPIDVAVISKSEGFVWIKRKHYFPAELNSRYFARLNRISAQSEEEVENGKKSQARQKAAPRRRGAKGSNAAETGGGAGYSGRDTKRVSEPEEGSRKIENDRYA